MLQRKASEDQTERHARKYEQYDSCGRLYLRRHPEVALARQRELEEEQQRLDQWQARYEAGMPVCSFAEHAWRIYNKPQCPRRSRASAVVVSDCPANEEAERFSRRQTAEEGSREDYDDCLAQHTMSRPPARVSQAPLAD